MVRITQSSCGTGARLVNSNWNPDNHKLNVNANDLENQNDNLGVRPSRCFILRFANILSSLESFFLFPEASVPSPDIFCCL